MPCMGGSHPHCPQCPTRSGTPLPLFPWPNRQGTQHCQGGFHPSQHCRGTFVLLYFCLRGFLWGIISHCLVYMGGSCNLVHEWLVSLHRTVRLDMARLTTAITSGTGPCWTSIMSR